MTQPFLSIQNVQKNFGTVKAVSGVNLDIYENEFFALLGASGSGKTTLLRMLAGFEQLNGGDVQLEGTSIAHLPPNQRPVNLMFQSYALFPHMTVAQNIAYGLEMDKLPKAQIKDSVDEILQVIQLGHLAKRKPDQLSGGQRQRVALARALVKRPKVLLLDEPLSALDKKLRSEMQLELKRLQAEFGITFIIVTHDQEEALVMADRIAIMKDGEIVQTGTPEDIVTNPADEYVADFVQGISKLKLVFAHTVMVPVAKYEKENKKLPAIKNCPQAGPEDDLDTLLTKVVDQDKPLVIMDDDKPVGVVTKDALLHAIRGES